MGLSRMSFKIIVYDILLFCMLIQVGCRLDTPLEYIKKKKTVLMYVVADNNLDYVAIENINEMGSSFIQFIKTSKCYYTIKNISLYLWRFRIF